MSCPNFSSQNTNELKRFLGFLAMILHSWILLDCESGVLGGCVSSAADQTCVYICGILFRYIEPRFL